MGAVILVTVIVLATVVVVAGVVRHFFWILIGAAAFVVWMVMAVHIQDYRDHHPETAQHQTSR
jgi:hypothetical protein